MPPKSTPINRELRMKQINERKINKTATPTPPIIPIIPPPPPPPVVPVRPPQPNRNRPNRIISNRPVPKRKNNPPVVPVIPPIIPGLPTPPPIIPVIPPPQIIKPPQIIQTPPIIQPPPVRKPPPRPNKIISNRPGPRKLDIPTRTHNKNPQVVPQIPPLITNNTNNTNTDIITPIDYLKTDESTTIQSATITKDNKNLYLIGGTALAAFLVIAMNKR